MILASPCVLHATLATLLELAVSMDGLSSRSVSFINGALTPRAHQAPWHVEWIPQYHNAFVLNLLNWRLSLNELYYRWVTFWGMESMRHD